jgi:hypothetical protein
MARRTAAEIFSAARAAGLSVASATIATAIALAESSGDDAAVGDVDLQQGDWGPSVGVWQIRTLKSQTGTGKTRDIRRLQGNMTEQARSMVEISRSGTDWTPWTVFTKGKYQNFMGQAQGASTGSTAVTPAGGTTLLGNPVTDSVDAAVEASVDAARDIMLKTTALGLGLVLLGVGVVYAMKPAASQALASKKAGEQKMRAAVGFG